MLSSKYKMKIGNCLSEGGNPHSVCFFPEKAAFILTT